MATLQAATTKRHRHTDPVSGILTKNPNTYQWEGGVGKEKDLQQSTSKLLTMMLREGQQASNCVSKSQDVPAEKLKGCPVPR